MEFLLIDLDSNEWNYIWGWIEQHPLNEGLVEPKSATNNGAEWEYVGSYKQGDRILHQVRHLCHPTIDGPIKLSLAASSELTEEQIVKTFRVK